MKALFVTAGNPVLSTPNGPALEEALGQLELMVVLDLYVSETSAYADYILPGTAMYEREDAPFFSGTFFAKPFIQVTDAVVPPAGEARPEWKFFDELIRGIIGPLGKLPVAITPKRLLDSIIRTGRDGDKFGLRPNGLSFSRLLKHHPHGYIFAEQQPVGRLSKVVHHKDKKVHLEYPEIYKEIDRLSTRKTDPAYPLRLIGMREIRSENSWMHNSPSLRVARTPHAARMHPEDAAKLGLIHHGLVRLVSKSGSIELTVLVTEDIKSGVVAVPHGWGHKGKGRWQRANKEGGVNINVLASSDPQDLEMLVGSSHLSGIHIRAERVFEATKQINDTGVYA
jgi:anaerobic selenocysteine-containing dehydrogenase